MSFSITEFNSEMSKQGFAIPAYFAVFISLPPVIGQQFPGYAKSLPMRIEAASIPDRAILTHDQRYYGPVRKIPYGFTTDKEFQITVILSEDYREREMFMAWQDMMVGDSRKSPSPRKAIFDGGYYNDAVKAAGIEIWTYAPAQGAGSLAQAIAANPLGQAASKILTRPGFNPIINEALNILPSDLKKQLGLNQDIAPIHKVTLIEPFPLVMNDIQLNWSDVNYAKMNISFSYRYFEEQNFAPTNPGELSLLGKVSQMANRFKPVVSILNRAGVINDGASKIIGAF